MIEPGARPTLPSPDPSARPVVLFLINDLIMGGAERSLVNLVNHLHHVRPAVVVLGPADDLLGELNPELHVFSLDGRAPGLVPMSRQAPVSGMLHKRRGRPRGQMVFELPGLLQKALRLARLARDTDSRVVSTFLNRSHTIALLAKFLFARRLHVVINVHEMLSRHLELHFSPIECRLMRAFIRHGFQRARRIIAVSDGVRDDLMRHFSIPAERITVVPNPIDLRRIRTASEEVVEELDAGATSPLVVGVGRLVKLKGFDVLIRAFARLPKELHARLLIIGEGEERSALARLVSELKMDGRVELMGTRVNPWKYMARADVIALSSRTEAFPNVIGEALALSVPIVATRCSEGVAEYLDGGRCGLLVPSDDVAALAAALERVLRDGPLRQQLIRAGAPRAETFGLSQVVHRYERFITEASVP